MAQSSLPASSSALALIEPFDRMVVLARILHAPAPDMEAALTESTKNWTRFGETCVGQALYRHRSFFQNSSGTPAWSHVELSYFRGMVPEAAITAIAASEPPSRANLLRAEILLTTPCSFMLPIGWRGLANQAEKVASLEFIQVEPRYFADYRDVMRNDVGPLAEKLVRRGRFGTFRAMETAAVLYRAPDLKADWNQIHLCELNPAGFRGFGPEFETVQREDEPERADMPGVFAGLSRIRTVPCWTFNDPVVEADLAVAHEGRAYDAATRKQGSR